MRFKSGWTRMKTIWRVSVPFQSEIISRSIHIQDGKGKRDAHISIKLEFIRGGVNLYAFCSRCDKRCEQKVWRVWAVGKIMCKKNGERNPDEERNNFKLKSTDCRKKESAVIFKRRGYVLCKFCESRGASRAFRHSWFTRCMRARIVFGGMRLYRTLIEYQTAAPALVSASVLCAAGSRC